MASLTFESTSKTIELDHGQLHYHEVGEGPALLLLHGSGPGVTGWANYEGNLPIFSEHFRCIVVDFPGYGLSVPIGGDPVQGCIDATLQLLNKLRISKAHIIGNSLGGIVGSRIAANHQDLVERFVTIGGVGLNLLSTFPGEGLNLLTAFAEKPSRERLESWLRSMVYDQSIITNDLIDARFSQATETITLETTRKIYSREAIARIAAMRHSSSGLSDLAYLAEIHCPTLITWGRDDRVSPLDIGLIPMRIVPNAELHVFPNCGHWAMIECKPQFESLVLSFLTCKR